MSAAGESVGGSSREGSVDSFGESGKAADVDGVDGDEVIDGDEGSGEVDVWVWTSTRRREVGAID